MDLANIVGGDATAPPRRDRALEIIQLSEPVAQILGVPPHWLARSGSLAMLGVLALLIGLAFAVHYPDVIDGDVVIGTRLPPATVVAPASGHLESLSARDGDGVAAGQVLARIATSADPAAVARLETLLAGWDDAHLPTVAAVKAIDVAQLGELRADFAAFARAHADQASYESVNPAAAALTALASQRQPLQDRLDSLQRQRALRVEETRIAELGLQRYNELARQRDAAAVTVEDRERIVLAAKQTLEALDVDAANTRLDLAKLELEIVNTTTQDQQRREELRSSLREAMKTLSGKLALFERTYVLRAPIAGTLSLARFFETDSQFVKAGDEVMAVIPAGAQRLIGRILLPINRAGSARIGETVYVQLENYPADRFGLVKGRVAAISPAPLAAHFAVTMELPDGLTTTLGRTLAPQQEMQGKAEIVVEDLRVIDRIFYQFRRALLDRAH